MTAQSEDAVDGDDNQKSELTVGAPKTDTSYTCTVSDPLGTASDPMTVELNVFGEKFQKYQDYRLIFSAHQHLAQIH